MLLRRGGLAEHASVVPRQMNIANESLFHPSAEDDTMVTRRTFLTYCGGTTLALIGYSQFGIKQVLAQIPGGSLDPASVPSTQHRSSSRRSCRRRARSR
jgi:hypothetical protein